MWYLFPFELQLQKGCKQSAALGLAVHSHRVKVRCFLFAATLGRCHLAGAEAVLELVQPF